VITLTNQKLLPTHGEYLGGHSKYAKKRNATIALHSKELVVKESDLNTPYSIIEEAKNVSEYST